MRTRGQRGLISFETATTPVILSVILLIKLVETLGTLPPPLLTKTVKIPTDDRWRCVCTFLASCTFFWWLVLAFQQP
jgi:hypothetical protein